MGRSAAASKPRVLLANKQGTFGRPAFYRTAKMRQKKMCNFGDAPIPAPGVPSLPGELAIGVEAEKLVPHVKWVPSGERSQWCNRLPEVRTTRWSVFLVQMQAEYGR
jgi:hypothetical protein